MVSLTDNLNLYGKSYGNGKVYLCLSCHASTGVREDLVTPNGYLADSKIKSLRMEVHKLLDPLWEDGHMSEKKAYKFLAKNLNIRAT